LRVAALAERPAAGLARRPVLVAPDRPEVRPADRAPAARFVVRPAARLRLAFPSPLGVRAPAVLRRPPRRAFAARDPSALAEGVRFRPVLFALFFAIPVHLPSAPAAAFLAPLTNRL
jgi:hypothetical protein